MNIKIEIKRRIYNKCFYTGISIAEWLIKKENFCNSCCENEEAYSYSAVILTTNVLIQLKVKTSTRPPASTYSLYGPSPFGVKAATRIR